MPDAMQTFPPPILAIYDDAAALVGVANGATVLRTYEMLAFPCQLEYIRITSSNGGPYDAEISQDAFTLPINTIYRNLASAGNINDNLLKSLPVGRFRITIVDTGNEHDRITITVQPDDEDITLRIINNSGGASTFVVEIGYRLMNKGIDLRPSLNDDTDAVAGVSIEQISAQSV